MKNYLIAACLLAMTLAARSEAGAWVNRTPDSAADASQELNGISAILAGAKSSHRVVYVFMDPNCPYCNDLWKALRTARAPDVQLRYLLVAVISDDSRGKDAAILESPDPLDALEKNERTFDEGGLVAKPTVQPATNQIIGRNEALMARLRIFGTPGLVYRDEHNELKVFAGLPDGTQLRKIVGER